MTSQNKNLNAAKKAKNDEFYTMLSDIEKEMKHYREHFRGKTIFLNCDDDSKSNFWKFFEMNFHFLGIKKVISTHYDANVPTYKVEILRNEDGSVTEVTTPLTCNGDFRSPECVEILEEADLVITNPPFSLFREFIELLVKHDKKFLVIGSLNAITYKEIFPLIQSNKMWLGVENGSKEYVVPNSYDGKFYERDGVKYSKLGNTGWFTNLEHFKRKESTHLFRDYNSEEHPTYDNYDAIDVSKVSDIPRNYEGVMGVPITFLIKYNPEQFEIVGSNRGVDQDPEGVYGRGTYLNGKETFKRIFIKRK